MSLHLLLILAVSGFGEPLSETLNISLDSAFQLALRQSPARVEAEVARSQAALSAAQAVNTLLPVPSATLSRNTSRTRSLLFPDSVVTAVGWTGMFTLSQVVFDPQVFAAAAGGFVYAGYYAAQAQEHQAKLLLDVTTDYLNLLKASLLRSAAASALKRAEENLTLTRCRETLGALSRIEVLRAETFRSQAEVNLLAADNAVTAANAALLATIGIDQNVAVNPTEELQEIPHFPIDNPESLLAEIERVNPGCRLGAKASSAAALSLAGAIGRALPSASFRWQSTYTDSLPPTSIGRWGSRDDISYGLTFSLPLLDLKSYSLNVAGAAAEARRTRAAAAKVKLNLRSTARAAIASYDEACRRLGYTSRNLRLNEELYELALTQRRLGTLSSLDFYSVEAALEQARAEHTSALCDTYIQAARISYLLGRTRR